MKLPALNPLKTTLFLVAALSVSAVLGAASPASSGAAPIATGDAVQVSPNAGPLHLEFALVELPNGALEGGGVQTSADGLVAFDLDSQAQLGDVLCMAGPITAAVNSPFSVGSTWILCIEDNGNGGSGTADRVAVAVGPPGLTVEAILEAFPGFLPPPDSEFRDVVDGNLTVH